MPTTFAVNAAADVVVVATASTTVAVFVTAAVTNAINVVVFVVLVAIDIKLSPLPLLCSHCCLYHRRCRRSSSPLLPSSSLPPPRPLPPSPQPPPPPKPLPPKPPAAVATVTVRRRQCLCHHCRCRCYRRSSCRRYRHHRCRHRRKAATLAKKQRPWQKVGSELMEVNMISGERVPKCSEKNRSTQYFVPDTQHASFAPK